MRHEQDVRLGHEILIVASSSEPTACTSVATSLPDARADFSMAREKLMLHKARMSHFCAAASNNFGG